MEKFFSQKRVLVYIIIALLVFNAATIASIFFFKNNHGEPRGEWNRKMKPGTDFIKEKLNLSKEQQKEYQVYHDQFWQKGKIMVDSLQMIRKQLLNQVLNKNPDTAQIALLNKKFGNLHVQLKNNTIDFYFKLRSICTPTQQDSLKVIITRMLEFEGGRRPFKSSFHEQHGNKKRH